MRDRHTSDADLHHGVFERLKARLLADYLDLRELRRAVIKRRDFLNGYRVGYGCVAAHGDRVFIAVIEAFDGRYEIGVGARQTVFGLVKTPYFFFGRYAQTYGLFENEEGRRHHRGSPRKYRANTEELNAEQTEAAGVKQSLDSRRSRRIRKQTDSNSAPHAVSEMHTHRSDGIVDMKFDIQEFDDEYHEQTGYGTDDRRTECVERVAAGGDADESRKGSVYAHRHVGLAVFDPCKDHRNAGRNGGSYRRGDEYRSKRVAVPRGGSVKAVPAEPQYKAAERAERDRMPGDGVDLADLSRLILNVFTETRTDHDRADQRRDTADRVDRRGARKIVESELNQPAVFVPHPARLDRIDEERDHAGIDAV